MARICSASSPDALREAASMSSFARGRSSAAEIVTVAVMARCGCATR